MTRKIRLTEEEQKLRQLLLDVSDYIAGQGCAKPELRFTGGWVRDKLLGITSKDIDIGISSMTGYRFGTLMKQYLEKSTGFAKYGQDVVSGLAKIAANPEKSKHLETVTTRIMGLDIDLVNLRRETYVEDSRNPTMEFGTAEEDALRRDSTVNALFYNLSTAEVEDLTSKGLNDMDLKIIRTPLSPYQTFKDDPLRVLRCIRFASKLGYSIDIEAERSMSDTCIKEALRAKITRERVGLEIDKMLKGKLSFLISSDAILDSYLTIFLGPQPHTALSLVDRLGLYDIIFTDPNTKAALEIDTRNWKRAYNQLFELLEESNVRSPKLRHMQAVRELLLFNPEQEYLAWLLCSLTPWARIGNPKTQKPGTKRLPPMAAVVAREGLKLENKSLNVVRDSVLHLDEIIASKDALSSEFEPASVPTKRKRGPLTRDQLGMCIRRWGSQWRSSVLFALLVQCMETDHEHGE